VYLTDYSVAPRYNWADVVQPEKFANRLNARHVPHLASPSLRGLPPLFASSSLRRLSRPLSLVIARAAPPFEPRHCEVCSMLLQNYKLLSADRSNLLVTTRLIARASASFRILGIARPALPFAPRHCEDCLMLLHHYKLLSADRSNLLVMTCLIARASASFRILVITTAVPPFAPRHCEVCLMLLQNYKLLTADRSNLLMTTRLIARAATSLRILVITTAVPPFEPRHCEVCLMLLHHYKLLSADRSNLILCWFNTSLPPLFPVNSRSPNGYFLPSW